MAATWDEILVNAGGFAVLAEQDTTTGNSGFVNAPRRVLKLLSSNPSRNSWYNLHETCRSPAQWTLTPYAVAVMGYVVRRTRPDYVALLDLIPCLDAIATQRNRTETWGMRCRRKNSMPIFVTHATKPREENFTFFTAPLPPSQRAFLWLSQVCLSAASDWATAGSRFRSFADLSVRRNRPRLWRASLCDASGASKGKVFHATHQEPPPTGGVLRLE